MGENIIHVHVLVHEKPMFLISITSVRCSSCIHLDLFFFPITDSDFGWVKSIRAMVILSVMFFGAGFVSFTLKIWVLKTRKEFEYLGIASTFAGGLNKNFFD